MTAGLRRDGRTLKEDAIEAYLDTAVRKAGGKTFKFAPTVKGNPDRLVLMPWGRMYLVEMKRFRGNKETELNPAQEVWHARARTIGHVVHRLASREDVDAFVVWAIKVGVGGRDARRQFRDDLQAVEMHYMEDLL